MGLLLTSDMLHFITTVISLLASTHSVAIDELRCMTEAIYFEARGEGYIGQVAVGNVIFNRVNSSSFPDTVCEVVHQGRKYRGQMVKHKCQFSYYCDGKLERIRNKDSFLTAVKAATAAMTESVISIQAATHYHTVDVNPYWGKRLEYLGRIGKHEFYR